MINKKTYTLPDYSGCFIIFNILSTNFEILASNSINPFVILRRNNLHISFTCSFVFNPIKLYFTLLSVSIQSSLNSIFLTFLFLASGNNSFNLDVSSARDVVPFRGRSSTGGEASLKYTSDIIKNWEICIFWDVFIKQQVIPLFIQLFIYFGVLKIVGAITTIQNCRQNPERLKFQTNNITRNFTLIKIFDFN